MQRMKCCDVFDWHGWSHATISPDLCWMTPLAFRVGLTANRCSLEFLGYMAALATSLSFPCMESSCLAIFCKDFWQKKTVLLFVIYSFWCWSGCCRYCNATAVWIWIGDLQFVGKCWKLLPWQWLYQTSRGKSHCHHLMNCMKSLVHSRDHYKPIHMIHQIHFSRTEK